MKTKKIFPALALLISVFSFSAYAQSQPDVYLLNSKEPVYSRMQISSGYDTGVGYHPFQSIEWVYGNPGYFVVGGNCNSNAGNFNPSSFANYGDFESGGMYVLKEDGSFVGIRDVCFDTSDRAGACWEGGGCFAGSKVLPMGSNKFIRQLNPEGYGFARSPVLYEITESLTEPISDISKLFYNDLEPDLQGSTVGKLGQFDDVAYAGNKMIGVATRYAGFFPVGPNEQGVPGPARNRYSIHTEVYDLPSMNKLASYSEPWPPKQQGASYSGAPPTTRPIFYPLIGVGDYVIAYSFKDSGKGLFEPLQVYKMPTSQQLASGQQPQLVQTFSNRRLFGYSFDVLDPNRIVLYWASQQQADLGVISGTLAIYEPGQNGLNLVKEREATIPVVNAFYPWENFAVAGDYIAYGKCPPESERTVSATLTYNGCEIVVERNGTNLAVEPLPRAKYLYDYQTVGDTQYVVSIAISPAGKIAVATKGGPDNGNIYLYQIKNFQGNFIENQTSASGSKITRFLDRLKAYLGSGGGGGTSGATCTQNGGFCSTTQPGNSQSLSGACTAGLSCYKCNSGYSYTNGQCVQGQTQPSCSSQPRTLCEIQQVSGATLLEGYTCAQLHPSIVSKCYQCPSGMNADPIEGKCVTGTVLSYCENNPGMKCIANPNTTTMQYTSKYCGFDDLDGAPYWFSKGCVQCKPGYTWSGSKDFFEKCVGSGSGGSDSGQQNLKIADITTDAIGNVVVSYCKAGNTVLSGIFSLTIHGNGAGGFTQTYNGISLQDLPLCPSTNWDSSVHKSGLWQSPTGQKSVTATATFPSQYNSITSDDTMTKTVTLQ